MWSRREVDMDPVALHVPLLGSYSSAVATISGLPPMAGRLVMSKPPATRTFPLGRSVAV